MGAECPECGSDLYSDGGCPVCERNETITALRTRLEEAEKVVDATDTITPVMCADSRVPDWHRLRLRDIVEARNLYRSLTPEVPHE